MPVFGFTDNKQPHEDVRLQGGSLEKAACKSSKAE